MEAPPEKQPKSRRERISARFSPEAARRSRPEPVQQFRNILHHEISSGTVELTFDSLQFVTPVGGLLVL